MLELVQDTPESAKDKKLSCLAIYSYYSPFIKEYSILNWIHVSETG